ncbi:MAG TPA: YbaB/EbfC family nucleoid-associated protein [Candidatus Mcinerneyibacterium sp.]|nr:YbaB/EbfC family nucleoid-associated protein [Candidatus Mcinerneyibacterium sp.]
MFGGNMKQMMQQAQKMQKKMKEEQEKLEKETIEAQAGGGMVKVKVNGKKEIVNIDIEDEVIDPDDKEMLQDLILAAVNEAITKMDEHIQEKMSEIAGPFANLF